MVSSKYGSLWNRDELILALYLYCQIPFAKTKANNPEVIKLAKILGRTPSSVARKLGNFGGFDPLLAEQGITGLAHAGKGDRLVWDEFHHHWQALIKESIYLLTKLALPASSVADLKATALDEDEEIIARPSGPSERQVSVSVRLFQSFFRRTVLASYNSSCCVCGLNLRPLLVASHIVPWSVDESARTEPENGLCLCAIHDRAFDRGVITISDRLEVAVASKIISSEQDFVKTALVNFHRRPLRMPKRFAPREQFLDWHRKHIFEHFS
jgi:hypothetical protein